MRDVKELRIQVTRRNKFPRLYALNLNEDQNAQLSIDEIVTAVRAGVEMGIRNFRLVGGEPLERADIIDVIKAVKAVEGVELLSMTSNGTLFAGRAEELKEAGIDSADILLDTFGEERYIYMTGGAPIDETMDALEAALRAGMKPVRVVATIIAGLNESDILTFGQLALNEPMDVVFLERRSDKEALTAEENTKLYFMPIGDVMAKFKGMVKLPNNDPLIDFYKWFEAQSKLGFISYERASAAGATVEADGTLKKAMYDNAPVDIKAALSAGDVEAVKAAYDKYLV